MSDEMAPMKIEYRYDQIAAALASAQAEYKPAVKNSTNPHFKNKYADLTSIIDATRDALCKHGLAFTQLTKHDNGRIVIISRLIHKSGQCIENEVSLKVTQDTPQGYGSTITYGRRYGAQCLLGINGEDDDDGSLGSAPAADQSRKIAELEKMLEMQRATVNQTHRLIQNIDLMLKFYDKFKLNHADIIPICDGRTVKEWTEKDVEVLRNCGVQLSKGAEWSTILEMASTTELVVK